MKKPESQEHIEMRDEGPETYPAAGERIRGCLVAECAAAAKPFAAPDRPAAGHRAPCQACEKILHTIQHSQQANCIELLLDDIKLVPMADVL